MEINSVSKDRKFTEPLVINLEVACDILWCNPIVARPSSWRNEGRKCGVAVNHWTSLHCSADGELLNILSGPIIYPAMPLDNIADGLYGLSFAFVHGLPIMALLSQISDFDMYRCKSTL